MEKEVTKLFSQSPDGSLTINQEEKNIDLMLPSTKGSIKIGYQDQVTIQHINKDDIVVLHSFINNQVNAIKAQTEKMESEYKSLMDVKDDIPEELLKKIENALNTSQSKKFKDECVALSQYIVNIRKKNQLVDNIKVSKDNYEKANKDLVEITKYL